MSDKLRQINLPRSISFRKEVIQPQVPLRLPCYDLVPVIELTVGRRLPAPILECHPSTIMEVPVSQRTSENSSTPISQNWCGVSNPTSGTPNSHHLTGGVYKAQEHIHRVVADTRLLAIPTSCRRVASLQSELGRLFSDLLHLAVSRRFVAAIVARVKPWA
jgi:hypothetical protein